ncbi:hypothetical protein E2C01_060216 [Portunus trituberculatus]|uniref:Uncharacterized protein n=1 Tax=Portunus trituberculatus TaxID=210409 RepID=A0A5B7HBF9_PORTR|nr:hypothetical protein [Portunus trituberculatus]
MKNHLPPSSSPLHLLSSPSPPLFPPTQRRSSSSPCGAEFTQQNSAFRFKIRPQNSSHTSEILQWNSASTSETFTVKASRVELTHPPETKGKARKAAISM